MRGQGTPQGTRQDTPLAARDRLIVALDLPSLEAAQAMVARLGDAVSFYKIGYQLAFAGGLAYAQTLAGAGKRVFLDLKLHDIGNTVAQGVKSVARLGASFLTVHAYPQTMQAAVDAREAGLRILAVTVLTSYDDNDLKAAGYGASVRSLAASRAAQARAIGVDGLVCSAEEAAALRAIAGPEMALV
ncbi:MAG: orotidine-5'-phosphate decarboxylase, partial [Xanthobacteraceae bacterium]